MSESGLDDRVIETLNRMDQDMPSIPAVLGQIMNLTDSDESSAGDLVRVLSRDQALTARILRVANSAFYGIRNKVTTVDRAVLVLGFEKVRRLAVGASFMAGFSNRVEQKRFDLDGFWLHAAAVGVFSERLARERGAESPGDAFTAGILHDIGKLVMLVYFEAEFFRVLDRAARDEIDFHHAEMLELGLGHDLVAGLVLRHWYIPDHLAEAVREHHHPATSGAEPGLAARVWLADYAARRLEIGFSGSPHLDDRPDERPTGPAFGDQALAATVEALAGEKERIVDLAGALAEA